jgi:hypothetical protein
MNSDLYMFCAACVRVHVIECRNTCVHARASDVTRVEMHGLVFCTCALQAMSVHVLCMCVRVCACARACVCVYVLYVCVYIYKA